MTSSLNMVEKETDKNNIPCNARLVILKLQYADDTAIPSPFLVGQSIYKVAGKIEALFFENGGARYTLKVNNADQATTLLNMKTLIDGTPVIVTPHIDNNVTRCVIKCPYLMDLTEKELLERLASQGVISVRRITRKTEEGLQKHTANLVLSFSGLTFPDYVIIDFYQIKTKPYYPELIQCYNCWQFWHIKPHCSCDTICGTCSGPHETKKGNICPVKSYCQKCDTNEHPISSRMCPKYVTERAIARIKIDRNISYAAAKEAYKEEQDKSDVMMGKLKDLKLNLEKDSTQIGSKAYESLQQQNSDLQLIIKKRDREIEILRELFRAMERNQMLTTANKPEVPKKPHSLNKKISESSACSSKVSTKKEHSQATDEKQQNQLPAKEDITNNKTQTGKSRKKKRGKGKK